MEHKTETGCQDMYDSGFSYWSLAGNGVPLVAPLLSIFSSIS